MDVPPVGNQRVTISLDASHMLGTAGLAQHDGNLRDVYSGKFDSQGQRQGHGTRTLYDEDGKVRQTQEGDWLDGWMHGKGKTTEYDSATTNVKIEEYDGEFEHGSRQGFGKRESWAPKTRNQYVGQFWANRYHGVGISITRSADLSKSDVEHVAFGFYEDGLYGPVAVSRTPEYTYAGGWKVGRVHAYHGPGILMYFWRSSCAVPALRKERIRTSYLKDGPRLSA